MDKEIVPSTSDFIYVVKGTRVIGGIPMHWNVKAFPDKQKAEKLLSDIIKLKQENPVITKSDRVRLLGFLRRIDIQASLGDNKLCDPLYYVEPLLLES